MAESPVLYMPMPAPLPHAQLPTKDAADEDALRAALQAALQIHGAPSGDSGSPDDSTAGHAALRALLHARGGGSLSVARSLTHLVGFAAGCQQARSHPHAAIQANNLCHLAARALVSATAECLDLVAVARRKGGDAIVARLEDVVVGLVSRSNGLLWRTETRLQFDHMGVGAEADADLQLVGVSDADYWRAADRQQEDDAHNESESGDGVLRDRRGRLLVPVGRSLIMPNDLRLPCPVCQDHAAPRLRRCECGLEQFCSELCESSCLGHSCAESRARAQQVGDKVLAGGGLVIAMLTEQLVLPLRANVALRNIAAPCWYPSLDPDDHVALYQLYPLVSTRLRESRADGFGSTIW